MPGEAGTNTTHSTSSNQDQQQMTGHPVPWMLGAALGYLPLPLIVWAGVVRGEMSPYLFVSIWYMAYALLWAFFRQIQQQRTMPKECNARDESTKRKPIYARVALLSDVAKIEPKYLLWGIVFQCSWMLFTLAVTLVEPVVATVIFEFWPVFFGIGTLTEFWRKEMLEGKRGENSVSGMLALLFIGGVGVSLAVLSDAGTISLSDFAVVGGLLLALLSAIGTASFALLQQLMGKERKESNPPPPPTFSQAAIFAFVSAGSYFGGGSR